MSWGPHHPHLQWLWDSEEGGGAVQEVGRAWLVPSLSPTIVDQGQAGWLQLHGPSSEGSWPSDQGC